MPPVRRGPRISRFRLRVYIIASGAINPTERARTDSFLTVKTKVERDYGQALDGIEWRKLDLKIAGPAFADITGIKGLTSGMAYRAKRVIDLWWRIKDARYIAGRGYPEWVWRSVFEYLRVCGETGCSWRLIVD